MLKGMQKMLVVKIVTLNDSIDVPQYMTSGSAGVDLKAARDGYLESGKADLVPTGIRIALPDGYEAQIRPRSGLAVKYGITLINSPGTIDSDYRGEIKIPLINLSSNKFEFKKGDRIAQMIIAKYEQAEFKVVNELDDTKRGSGGFGHTGQ